MYISGSKLSHAIQFSENLLVLVQLQVLGAKAERVVLDTQTGAADVVFEVTTCHPFGTLPAEVNIVHG